MMETKKEDYAALTLDFWDNEVICGGKAYKAGSIACDAMNIPEEVISQLHTYSKNLNLFLGSINAGKADPKLLPMAKQSALKILSLIIQHVPFSYMDLNMCKDQIDTCLHERFMRQMSGKLPAMLKSSMIISPQK